MNFNVPIPFLSFEMAAFICAERDKIASKVIAANMQKVHRATNFKYDVYAKAETRDL